ncbi:MAG: substrate-binding domain-containing protein [Chloroflexota bacterium]
MGFGGHRSRGAIGLALLGAAALVTSGAAGRPVAQRSVATNDQDASFTPQRQGGIAGALLPSELKLWKYDAASGTYQVVDGDASAPYQPHAPSLPAGTKIGFEEGWAAIPFSASINKRVYELAAQAGAEVVYCDSAFDAAKAVSCAEQITSQGPAFVINSNWQSGAANAVAAIYDGARIPALSVDVIHPNEIFLGADNYTSGFIGGQAAGTKAQADGKCADTWLLLGENPGEGEGANQRLAGFADGVQTVCGALPADHITRELFDAGTTDQALTKATDWLTAHPQAAYVLSTSIDDARADGVAKALTQSSRDGYAVGLGCDDIGQASTKESANSQNHFLGCVAYFPEKYPDYAFSIASDVLAGTPVPQEVHLEHQFFDGSTISTVYP